MLVTLHVIKSMIYYISWHKNIRMRNLMKGKEIEVTKILKLSIRVFICTCPWHCEQNSCHNVKTFLLSSGFPAQIVTHIWRAKAKICSTFAFQFFLKFWTSYWCIQSSFHFHLKDITIFRIGQKMFGGGIPSVLENSFWECEDNMRRFLSSFRNIPQNVIRIPLTLLRTFRLLTYLM